MEIPNKVLVYGALTVMLGSNATSFINSINPSANNNGSTLEGERLRADMLELYTSHIIVEQKELEKIRQRISKCEYKINK